MGMHLLEGDAVLFKSSKQTITACSAIDSDFVVLEKTRAEAVWLRNLLVDKQIWSDQHSLCLLL